MLQADIVALEQRQRILEHEIVEASRNLQRDDFFVLDLKSRVQFIREEIERLQRVKEFIARMIGT